MNQTEEWELLKSRLRTLLEALIAGVLVTVLLVYADWRPEWQPWLSIVVCPAVTMAFLINEAEGRKRKP